MENKDPQTVHPLDANGKEWFMPYCSIIIIIIIRSYSFWYLYILSLRYIMRQQGQLEAGGGGVQSRPDPAMHLAVVACGDRLEETLTMIKSAVLFSIKHIYLHIFAEDQLHASFMEAVSYKYLEVCLSLCVDHILFCVFVHAIQYLSVFQLESWPGFIHSKFNYTVYSISFPSENAAEWKKLFKPCASQRLFLPVSYK